MANTMRDRQRDLFLWQWSQRRKRGLKRVSLLGALVGATGGLLFAAIMMALSLSGPPSGFSSLVTLVVTAVQVMVLSVPAFAAMCAGLAYRTFSRQELMYQTLVQGGFQVPQQEPVMQPGDRWPMYVVAVTAVLLFAFPVVLWAIYM